MRREPGGAPGVRVSVRARAHTRGRGQGAGRGERPEPALPARSPGSRGPGAGAERTDGQTDRQAVSRAARGAVSPRWMEPGAAGDAVPAGTAGGAA